MGNLNRIKELITQYGEKAKVLDIINKEKLLEKYAILNTKANKLLEEHKSFKDYNSVRVQMDEIEYKLRHQYNFI